MNTMQPVNLFEYEEFAKSSLPKSTYDSIAGGAGDEITIRRTRAILDEIMLRPSRLVDISNRDLSSTVLGQPVRFPIGLCPSAGHGMAHPDGELATVRAAKATGALMILSAGASFTIEAVAKEASGPIWLQHYLYKDRDLTLSMVQRAEDNGFQGICITLDTLAEAKYERNMRAQDGRPSPRGSGSSSVNYAEFFEKTGIDRHPGVVELIDLSATWADLRWLTQQTRLPVIVKGILRPEDALLSVEHGAKAIIVSNHGGRHIDTAITTIEALPEISGAVGNEAEIYLDGGIRRGTDIIKALCLGARAVLIGRPIFWGLALGGNKGLANILTMLYSELDSAMAMCGFPDVKALSPNDLALSSPLTKVFHLPPLP